MGLQPIQRRDSDSAPLGGRNPSAAAPLSVAVTLLPQRFQNSRIQLTLAEPATAVAASHPATTGAEDEAVICRGHNTDLSGSAIIWGQKKTRSRANTRTRHMRTHTRTRTRAHASTHAHTPHAHAHAFVFACTRAHTHTPHARTHTHAFVALSSFLCQR